MKLSPCHCFNFKRAENKLVEFYDSFFKTAGITANQYSILAHIKKLAPITVSSLAENLGLARTTLVRNLKPLEKRKLVLDLASNGRGRQLVLSEEGRKIQEKSEFLWQEAQKALETSLGTENLQNLYTVLEIILNKLEN